MKITDSTSFGTAIRTRRKALGYTQLELSKITGLSASFLSDLERGKKTIELGKALFIANMLGLNIHLHQRG